MTFLKKNISFENKKGTNVVTIEYKNKDPEVAYNVVNSILNNYIDLHKQLNAEKSKSDKEIIEKEYNKAKAELNKKVNAVSGLPEQAIISTGNLSAMSAFSSSARQAMSNIKGQVIAGERSRAAVSEEAAKVAELSSKLQWAKMVDEMSDTSKVLVLKEPKKLRDFEYSSPKLLINILLGIIFGAIAALFACTVAELTDKKVSYSMLGDELIYDAERDFTDLKLILLANEGKNVALVFYNDIPQNIKQELASFTNTVLVKADISNEFVNSVKTSDAVIQFVSPFKTDSKLYRQIKLMLNEMNKKIIQEVLVK